MSAKHTPTPWEVRGDPDSETAMFVIETDDRTIADVLGAASKDEEDLGLANAEFIVRAVNSHEALVAGLQAAELWLKALIEECDLDPEDTAYQVNIVSPEGKREVAKRTLAESQVQIAAALALAEARK